MGVFDLHCSESGIALDGLTRCALVVGDPKTRVWRRAAVPLLGVYDRYGKIESVAPSANVRAIEALGGALEVRYREAKNVEGVLASMHDDGADWNGQKVWFALFDDLVYRACVATVASGGKPGVPFGRREEFEATPFEALLERAFGQEPLTKALYAGLDAAAKEEMFADLVDFCLFVQWHADFEAIDFEMGGQYLYYHQSVADEQELPDDAVERYTLAAREQYRGFPLLLAAVEANAEVWKQRERENLEEEEEDDEDD